jgi:hypothetical protein
MADIVPYKAKTCRVCNNERSPDQFYKNEHSSRCKACEQSRKRYERRVRSHGEIDRRRWLKRNYGITPEQFASMEAGQGGKCAICGAGGFVKKGKLCVDHNHDTMKIRGLLCHSCNMGIGHFKDDISLLENAIKYLKNHG